ncbi:MAG: hypothetical protein GKR89_25160 [Candidatus Latescibacteria bacterium]|nr:hypothetical protein [Candidatus Latescibacterota bacterium]
MDNCQITPTNGPLGVHITGLDLNHPLTEETVIQLQEAFLQYSLLVFNERNLDKEVLLRFGRYFGEPVPHPTNHRDQDPEIAEICIISNIEEKGRSLGALGNEEVAFHADLVFLHTPGSVSILYCVEAPEQGGDTFWASGYAAYDALEAATKAHLEGLKAVYIHRNPAYNPPVPAAHPLVCTHPDGGRKTLFISPGSAHCIVGMEQGESAPLLAELGDHITQDRFVWSHSWQPGDLVMWDNRCTLHRRDPFAADQRRYMRRLQMLGRVS